MNHHHKHACEIWAHSEKLTYFIENADSACPRNIVKFQHFFKFHQIHKTCRTYWNHDQKHACENLSLFREVKFFHRKIPTVPALEIWLNFNIFSKVTKFHKTCRIYLNHHQKHACEIWAHSERLTYFIENADSARPRNIMKFQHFFTVHQISSNLQNILESSLETYLWTMSPFRELTYFIENADSARPRNIMKFQHFFRVHQLSTNLQNLFESSSETCMLNLSLFREVDLFHRKMRQCRPFEISWNFNIFQISSNFIKLAEHIGNHHQKHACEIWAFSEKLNFFTEKYRTLPALEIWLNFNIFQSSPNFIKLAEHIWIIIRNMHVKFEPIQRSWLIS